jgi:hypothetical protein
MMLRALSIMLAHIMSTLPAMSSVDKEWRFSVYLDDKQIGYHHFKLTPVGEGLQLSSEARFEVTFLKIPLYRYRHNSTELWNSECLGRITSSTDANGENNRLEGSRDGAAFVLNTQQAVTELPACVASFAYWNPGLLERERLLNPQTGDYLDARLEYLGRDSVVVAEEKTLAHRYRLTTGEQPIDLWYSAHNQWLGLQATVAGDRSLRYVIE